MKKKNKRGLYISRSNSQYNLFLNNYLVGQHESKEIVKKAYDMLLGVIKEYKKEQEEIYKKLMYGDDGEDRLFERPKNFKGLAGYWPNSGIEFKSKKGRTWE